MGRGRLVWWRGDGGERAAQVMVERCEAQAREQFRERHAGGAGDGLTAGQQNRDEHGGEFYTKVVAGNLELPSWVLF